MSRIISQTTKTHANGAVETVTEFEGGVTITSFSLELPDVPRLSRHRLRPGNDGLRQAIRVIDGKVERGEVTPSDAVQLEEDLITKYDREGW